MSKNKAYTHVSLFSGAGGLDIGLEQAGFRTVWANDFNHDACETHRLWSNATVVEGDIGKVDYDTIPDCDIASFGFPCQGFSLSGPRKIDDSRNILYRHCVKLVEKKQPKLFLAENVKGLLTLSGKGISVPCALQMESIPSTPLRIWKVTTSFLGARAGIPRMTTCRCCVRSAMRRSRIDKVDRENMMEYHYFMYGMFDGTDGNRKASG